MVLAVVFTVYDGITADLTAAEETGLVFPISDLLIAAFLPFMAKSDESPSDAPVSADDLESKLSDEAEITADVPVSTGKLLRHLRS
jgi:hypothetical protein